MTEPIASVDTPTPTPDRTARRRVATGSRIAAGVITLAIAAAGVAAAATAPLPTVSARAEAISADPSPGAMTLVCPSSFLVAGRDAGAAQVLAVAAAMPLSASTPSDAKSADLPIAGVEGASTRAITAQPQDGQRAAAAGGGLISPRADDAAGLAVGACRAATTEGWLVGIDARTGSTGVLVLTNPGTVTATVALTAYGVAGPAETPTTVSIPAGSAVAQPIAGLTGGDAAPVLHLSSVGAPIQASLQSAAVRGLTPAGVDIEDIVMTDADTQVSPGVRVTKAQGDAASTMTRVLATDASTTAHIVLREAGGTREVADHEVKLTAGIPVEVPFDGVKPGTYDVVVRADAPVVAATWHASGGGKGDDYTWYPAAPVLDATSDFAVVGGVDAKLHVVNSGDGAAEVTITTGSDERTVTIDAGGSEVVNVGPGTGRVSATGGSVTAAVTYADGRQTATTPLWPADAAATAITVVH